MKRGALWQCHLDAPKPLNKRDEQSCVDIISNEVISVASITTVSAASVGPRKQDEEDSSNTLCRRCTLAV